MKRQGGRGVVMLTVSALLIVAAVLLAANGTPNPAVPSTSQAVSATGTSHATHNQAVLAEQKPTLVSTSDPKPRVPKDVLTAPASSKARAPYVREAQREAKAPQPKITFTAKQRRQIAKGNPVSLCASDRHPLGTVSCLSDVLPTSAPVDPQTMSLSNTQYSPQQTAYMYGLADSDGNYVGQPSSAPTVALVEAGDAAALESNLAGYRSTYGLAPCTTANGCFTKVNETGGADLSGSGTASASWVTEQTLDVDAVTALCPSCHILVVEAPYTGYGSDLATAAHTAAEMGAKYVSMSFGSNEVRNGWTASQSAYYDSSSGTTVVRYRSDPQMYDAEEFNLPGTTFVASTGDNSTNDMTLWPASGQNVVAAGGTVVQLAAGTVKAWEDKSGTTNNSGGSGSGCSAVSPAQAWQQGNAQLAAACPGGKANSDVSALSQGFAIDVGGSWYLSGGTSLAAPLLATMYALTGEDTGSVSVLDTSAFSNPTQLDIATVQRYAYAHSGNFADPTVNSTSTYTATCTPTYLCNAAVGWDGPTGLGTPHSPSDLWSSDPTWQSRYSGDSPISSGNHTVTITAPATVSATVGQNVNVAVSATTGDGSTIGSNGGWGTSGGAPGVYLFGGANNGATFQGKPTTAGSYDVTVHANSATASGTTLVHFTVSPAAPSTTAATSTTSAPTTSAAPSTTSAPATSAAPSSTSTSPSATKTVAPKLTWSGIPTGSDAVLRVGTACAFNLQATRPDGSVVSSYATGGIPDGLTPHWDGTYYTITGTPTTPGTYSFNVAAYQETGYANPSASITLMVNAAAAPTTTAASSASTTAPASSTASTTATPSTTTTQTTTSTTAAPSTTAASSSASTTTAAPTTAASSSAASTSSAAPSSASASPTLSQTSATSSSTAPTASSSPPSATPPPVGGGPQKSTVTMHNPGNQSAYVGRAVNIDVSAKAAPEAGTIRYSAFGAPAGTSITSAGHIVGSPTTAGAYSVTVQAYNEVGSAVPALTFALTVHADTVTLRNPGNISASYGRALSLALSATSASGRAVNYSVTPLPTGLRLIGSHLSGTPTKVGASRVAVTASDGLSKASAAFTITVAKSSLTNTPKLVGKRKRGYGVKLSTWRAGSVTIKPHVKYQWYLGSKKIKHAMKSSYTVAKKYAGNKLTVKVTVAATANTNAYTKTLTVKIAKKYVK